MEPGTSTAAMEPKEELADQNEAVKDCIIAGLQEMYFSETLCDVAIVTEDKRFLGHRVVLASVSPYFKALFTCPMKESALGEVCLLDIPSSVMATILHYIYTGKAHLTLDNVEELFIISSRLQVTAMINICSSYLAKRIDDENCLWIYRLAHSHHHTSLLDAAINHIGVNVRSLSRQEDFFHLEMEELANILSSDNLMVSSELSVYNLARCWWKSRTKEDNPLPVDLLKAIRLQLLNPYDLEKVSRDIPREDPRFKLATGIRLRQGMFREKIICTDVNPFSERNQGLDSYMTTYDPQTDSWDKLPICGYLKQSGIVSVGYRLYVSGGFRQERCASNELHEYDAVLNEWKELPSMTHPRACHGFLAYRNMLYAFGGCNKNEFMDSVECFSVSDNSWHNVSSMPMALHSFTTSELKGRLFAIGGMIWAGSFSKRHQGFHIYDILTDTWRQFPLPVIFSAARAVPLDDKIYVIASYKIRRSEYSVHPSNDAYPPFDEYATYLLYNKRPTAISKSFCMDHLGHISYSTIPPFLYSLSGAAVVRWKHRIYIIGGTGYGGISNDEMVYWQPGKPRWSLCVPDLPLRQDDFQCVTLQVPLRRLFPIIPGRRSNYNFNDF